MALADHPLWSAPSHHEDLEHAHDHVHWVELFYDLIHVVCVFLLGNYLSHHLSIDGFWVFSALFIVIWMAWADSSFFNSLYVSTDIYHRFIMAAQITTVMVIAASIPHIPGKGEVYFCVAYAVNRAITAYLYHRAIRHNAGAHSMAREMSRNFFVAAALFLVTAFLPQPYNYYLFAAVIVGIQLSYLLPSIGVMRFERFTPRLTHLSERFALLFLIVMGEGFFKMVVTLSEKGIYKAGPEILFNFLLGGIAIFALTWAYFDFVGNGKPRDTRRATMVRWWYGHLTLMLSAIMIGVALKAEVKVGFMDPYPTKYAALGCGGLILFITSIAVIQSAIEIRTAHRFATWHVQVFGVIFAIITFLAVPYLPSILGNVLYSIALFSQNFIPLSRVWRAIKEGTA